jgi:uracil-DNA glycosylase
MWSDLRLSSGDWDHINQGLAENEICPSRENVFKAFELTSYQDTRVVIVGQDPYPNPRYACGLAFSIPRDCVTFPPSLRNIFTELKGDIGCNYPTHGDLSKWAKQGVLLLNSSLTCLQWRPKSQENLWFEYRTAVVEKLNQKSELIWVLWGKHTARIMGLSVPKNVNHHYIKSPHPSPYSAHTGFFHSKPFSKVNNYLKTFSAGKNTPIDWDLNV